VIIYLMLVGFAFWVLVADKKPDPYKRCWTWPLWIWKGEDL
jgi:hypothetical protein